MNRCPALQPNEPASACPERILSMTTEDLAHCRACPRGRALLETVRGIVPEAWLENLPAIEPIVRLKKEQPVSDKQSHTQSEVARAAGVTTGNMSYALKLIRQGREDLPPNARKIKDVMDRLGITPDDLTGKAPEAAPAAATTPAPVITEAAEVVEAVEATDARQAALAAEDRQPEPDRTDGGSTIISLAHVSLERLVAEITSRVPRALVVLR